MFDIPLGKALVPVEDGDCDDCYFGKGRHRCYMYDLCCEKEERKDGKNVIFKLVDWPEKK